jgi:signal transduction histidine kinase
MHDVFWSGPVRLVRSWPSTLSRTVAQRTAVGAPGKWPGLSADTLRGVTASVVSSTVALAASFVLAPIFNDAPMPLILAAVMVSSWYGGFWPGLLTTTIGAVALQRGFDLSRGAVVVAAEDTSFDLTLFIAVSLLISGLNARLRSLNRQVNSARAQAEAAVRSRDELLSLVAHDLASPLTGISLISQRARKRLIRGQVDDPEVLLEQFADIDAVARNTAGLAGDLLDLARLEANGRIPLNPMPVHLLALAEAAAQRHKPRYEHHKLHVLALADPVGSWDASRIGRVLDNLLSNAIKYSPAGGDIPIVVDRQQCRQGKDWAVVSVSDSGIGIPAVDLEHVFSRFYRAGNVGDMRGTGLGLWGARQIAEQHGGRLEVESTEGKGTTFTLRLPCPQPDAVPIAVGISANGDD